MATLDLSGHRIILDINEMKLKLVPEENHIALSDDNYQIGTVTSIKADIDDKSITLEFKMDKETIDEIKSRIRFKQ